MDYVVQPMEAKEGVRLSLYTGMLEYGHPDRMTTLHFYKAYEGERIRLLDPLYEFGVARYSMDRDDTYIYTYAYQENESWATFIPESSPHRYGQDVVVLKEEGYFRINLRRVDGKEIDASEAFHVNEIIKVEIPEKKDSHVVKTLYEDEIEDTVRKLQYEKNELLGNQSDEDASDDVMLIPILTDSHYCINGTWCDTMANLLEVNHRVPMDILVHLGDMTDGMVSRKVNADYVKLVKNDLKALQMPMYIVMGNHDTNYFNGNPERFSKEEQYWLYQGDCCDGAVREGHALYYYKDFDQIAVRAVFLHSFDEDLEYRYGFSDEEVEWLQQVLAAVPEGYRILIFSHVPPLPQIHFWNKNIRNGKRIVSVVEQDMRENGHTVLGWIHGHNHADQIYQNRAFPIISLGCTKIEDFKDKKPDGAYTPDRKIGEASQELWNILVVRKNSNTMKMIRFGAGNDMVIEKEIKDQRGIPMKKTEIWAHRGASAYAPENTLEAFQMAVDMQADGVELDVQLTRDGHLVVIHDETINRVSDGYGYVRDYTLEELKNLKFNKTHPEFKEATIPTLKEVFQLLKPTNLKINIELKTGIYFYEGIEQQVLDLVERYGMEDRIWYSSFNHYSVMKIKELKPDAKAGFLYCDGIYEPAAYAKSHGVEALHPAVYNLQYPEYVKKCKEAGIEIHTWTVNAFEDMARCIPMGLDAIITNYPDKARVFATAFEVDGETHYPFDNPFEKDDDRKFCLFGAGYQGKHFVKRYAGKYIPEKVYDNDEMKWGTEIEGIKVSSPKEIKPGDCVIIAGNYFIEIVKQLEELGIKEFYIYDDKMQWE